MDRCVTERQGLCCLPVAARLQQEGAMPSLIASLTLPSYGWSEKRLLALEESVGQVGICHLRVLPTVTSILAPRVAPWMAS